LAYLLLDPNDVEFIIGVIIKTSLYLEENVKTKSFILPLLIVLPLSAQDWEVGVFAGQQAYKSPDFTSNGVQVTGSADKKTVFAVRGGYAFVDLGPCLMEVTAAYQPKVTTTGTFTVDGEPGSGDFKTQYYAVGAMVNFKAFVAVGAGFDYRFEKLETTTISTNYGRPWFRANAGIAIPSPVVKPFIGVEVAFPLTSKSSADLSNNEELLKTAAPKSQIGIYAGIRF
jgi:hypothetical protein